MVARINKLVKKINFYTKFCFISIRFAYIKRDFVFFFLIAEQFLRSSQNCGSAVGTRILSCSCPCLLMPWVTHTHTSTHAHMAASLLLFLFLSCRPFDQEIMPSGPAWSSRSEIKRCVQTSAKIRDEQEYYSICLVLIFL